MLVHSDNLEQGNVILIMGEPHVCVGDERAISIETGVVSEIPDGYIEVVE